MISVIGAKTRESLLSHTGLRVVYSGMLDTIGAVKADEKEVDNDFIKKRYIKGFLVVSSDGNVVYMGESGKTGNVPFWARSCISIAEHAGALDRAESPSLSWDVRALVKEVELAASDTEIVSLSVGFNELRGSKALSGTLSHAMPGKKIGSVCAWHFRKGKPEPPIVYLTDCKVRVKWGCPGTFGSMSGMKTRVDAVLKAPARWIWED